MVPRKPSILPPISWPPSTDPDFVRAIDDAALLAGGLIASVDAAMLAIAVPSDRWRDGPPVVAWSQRLTASPALARTLIDRPMFATALDALCLATDALGARLETWRWDGVDAPGLCLVTDGIGVVLSSHRPPIDAGCGWLLDLARSRGSLTLRAPDVGGIWSLIVAESATLH